METMTCRSSTSHKHSLRISLDSTPRPVGNMSTYRGQLRCCCSCGAQRTVLALRCSVDRKRFRNVHPSKAAELLVSLLRNSTHQLSLFKLPLEIDSSCRLMKCLLVLRQLTGSSSLTRSSSWYIEADAAWLATMKFSSVE